MKFMLIFDWNPNTETRQCELLANLIHHGEPLIVEKGIQGPTHERKSINAVKPLSRACRESLRTSLTSSAHTFLLPARIMNSVETV